MRRLTLRTLLAYLDDTLDTEEIKDIGQRVGESDAAQELIARIKQVTRRRRLTVPPASGPSGMDANEVAEYLDNVLPSDRILELEKLAHESDVHLAEIASCHQILTLVLGEPALVPPKARERMYTLVQGREAIRHRKAQVKKPIGSTVSDEASLELSSGWLRYALPGAALLLVIVLGLAIYLALPPRRPDNRQVVALPDEEKVVKPDNVLPMPGVEGPQKTTASDPKPDQKQPPIKVPEKKEGPAIVAEKIEPEPPNPAIVERSKPPSKERVAAGNYIGGISDQPTALILREEGKLPARLAPGTRIFTNDTLITLPGFVSTLRCTNGVSLLMRGHVREFTVASIMDLLLESAVVLHANPKFDLDLTLLRGRIFLANRKDKGACTIRLRFESEVWDITLPSPGDEVGVDLTRSYSPAINYAAGEAPRARCYLAVLRGEANLKVDAFHSYTVEVNFPGWARLEWDSFTRVSGPFREDKRTPAWDKQPPPPDLFSDNLRRKILVQMQNALKNLEILLAVPGKSPETAFRESMEKPDPVERVLAIYCLGAIDSVSTLLDALGDEDPAHVPDREAAFFTLQRFVGRGAGNANLLFDKKTGTGILIDKRFRKGEAETVIQLLHPLLAEDLGKVETYEALANALVSRKVAIAEMAYWHLVWLSPNVKLPEFNAAAPVEQREKLFRYVQMLIEKKQLPPNFAERPREEPMPR